MLTIKKPAHKFVDLGISLCLLVFIAGCTPPEKTALLNGSKLLEGGQPERALVELDKALDFIAKNEELKRNPKIMGHLHNQIGFAHQILFRSSNGKTNHYSAAHRAYLFTTTNLSTPPALKQRAHLNLAWLYLERYKWNENLPAFRENAKRAANEFEKLRVSVTDDKFNYWLEKGTAELHAGRFPSARESFKKVDAPNANALNGLGILAALDRRNEAATRYFEAAIDADNKNPKSHLHLAITMQALGQFQEALDAYKAYLSLDPELSSKISHVNSLVEGLEDYLKPVPKEEPRLEPVAEKKEQVVELKSDGENEKVDRDEIIENKNPVDVASVTEPVEVIENKTIEESVVSAKQGEATEIPEEESVEIVVIEPPIEEEEGNIKSSDPKVLPVPAVQLREEPVGDNEKIEPFLSTINEKLEGLDREELIKHFVSAEFNRFISYYKNLVSSDKCVAIFTNEVALSYLLKKPTCSKFYFMYTSTPKNIQNQLIQDLSSNKPSFIIYSSNAKRYSSWIFSNW